MSPKSPVASRLTMVKRHLSTASEETEKPVIFENTLGLSKLVLNKPKSLNALDGEMVALIQPKLEEWEANTTTNVIVFKGRGKSFCAGGDVVSLVKNLNNPKEKWTDSSDFFRDEYTMNGFIGHMKKPVVSFLTGNTLGGGVGLSVHGAFRVATETTKIAMPETTIGLFPDVGGTYFLSRLDGGLGLYLGLTSDRIAGAGAFLTGFATHYIPQDRLEQVEASLAELAPGATHAQVQGVLNAFSADAEELKAGLASFSLVGSKRRAIDIIFTRDSVVGVLDGLRYLESGDQKLLDAILAPGEDPAPLQAWAKATKDSILARSPTSLALTHLALNEARHLTFDDALRMELRLATACCCPDVHPDFKTGVDYQLILKKRDAERPWSPAKLEQIKRSDLARIFFDPKPPFEFPILRELEFRHSGEGFTEYPHRHFALPSEEAIKSIVTGSNPSAGAFALTRREVIAQLEEKYGSRVGLKEKVDEVLGRKCTELEGGVLKWLK